MERTRSEIIEVEAADTLLRIAARGTVPLRRRGWRGDRLAVRAAAVPVDGSADEQDGGDGVGEDRQGPGEPSR
jgi:hypothetical protein